MKKILNLFFIFVLSCTLIVYASAVGNDDNRGGDEQFGGEKSTDLEVEASQLLFTNELPYDGLDEETIEIMKRQKPALIAYEEFMSYMEDDGEGNYLYPDSFAGAYLDTDTFSLCILLTDCSEEVTAEYDMFFSDPTIVEYIKAEYSYSDLVKIQNEIMENIKDYKVIGIDPKKNVVSIGVDRETETRARNRGENIFPKEYPIEIYYTEGVNTCSDELLGGTGVKNYTIGICGTYKGYDAILLCGHQLSVGDSISYNGRDIATVQKVRYADGERYDYAIATIDRGANVRVSKKVYNKTNYTTITHGLETDPISGTLICRYGAESGFATYHVLKPNQTVFADGRTTIKGLVSCRLYSGSESVRGDSGGPFYEDHVFYGVLHGSDGLDTYYSPYSGVTLNFDVLE